MYPSQILPLSRRAMVNIALLFVKLINYKQFKCPSSSDSLNTCDRARNEVLHSCMILAG